MAPVGINTYGWCVETERIQHDSLWHWAAGMGPPSSVDLNSGCLEVHDRLPAEEGHGSVFKIKEGPGVSEVFSCDIWI